MKIQNKLTNSTDLKEAERERGKGRIRKGKAAFEGVADEVRLSI